MKTKRRPTTRYLLGGLLLSILAAVLAAGVPADEASAVFPEAGASCFCNCHFDRDCAPGYFCNFKPLNGGSQFGSCLTNTLKGSCPSTSNVCDGICTKVGQSADHTCDTAVLPECGCNPRNSLNDGSGDNPQCPPGTVCVSDGGCCTKPGNGACPGTNTCNGRCVDIDKDGLQAASLCGNGVVDVGEECDPGDAANGVPAVVTGCTASTVHCVNCLCIEADFCAP